MVGLLLSRSTSLLKIADSKGQTCLHVAAANGHYEMVQALLGQGSDQTMIDKVQFWRTYPTYCEIGLVHNFKHQMPIFVCYSY